MTEKNRPPLDSIDEEQVPPDFLKEYHLVTETIEIADLRIGRDMTQTGSFDLRGIRESLLGKLLNALPTPTLLIDRSQTIVFTNSSFRKSPAGSKKLEGSPLSLIFSSTDENEKTLALIENVFSERKPVTGETLLDLGEGKIWARIHLRSVRVATKRLVLLIIEDLTLEKKQLLATQGHERQLLKARSELEKLVQERTTELLKTNEQLQTEIEVRQGAEAQLRKSRDQLEELVEARTAALRKTNQELLEAKNEWERTFDAVPDLIFILDKEHRVVRTNKPMAEKLGMSQQEIIGAFCFEVLHSTTAPLASCPHSAMLVDGKEHSAEVAEEHLGCVFDVTVSPLYDSQGQLLGSVHVARDITERKRIQEALQVQTERFETLSENAPFGMAMIAKDGTFEYVNPKFTEILGYELNDVHNGREWFRKAFPDPAYRDEAISIWIEDSEKYPPGQVRPRVFDVTCKDGSLKTIQFGPVQVGTGENVLTLEDITERKRDEERLKASLKEKEVLLKEIHHRVKNNLQMISSLVQLHSYHIDKRSAAGIVEDLENRIHAIAAVHEKLYQSESLMKIDMNEYIHEIAEHLFYSYGTGISEIRMIIDIGDIACGIDTAVPLGLMVSELISNCLKHAFPDGKTGAMTVSLKAIEGDQFELSVKDDGIGMTRDLETIGAQTLGLSLVKTFAEQLHAGMEIKSAQGTEFRFRFREIEKRRR